jgi:8-oxo-dGTP pyrophosphatase MutT (NUDIX family)
MRLVLKKAGVFTFWLTWPLTFLYVLGSQRTRVLLVSGNKVLVCHIWHSPGRWSLPGGGIHKKELPAEGAARELKEEIGIQLQPLELQPLGKIPYKSHGLRFECHFFVAEVDEQLPVRPRLPEIIDAAWIESKTLTVDNSETEVLKALDTWSTSKALLQ